jgi:dTMP kinase
MAASASDRCFAIAIARRSGSMFFSFDGIDGVGKSTQLTLFAQWLRESGHAVVTCRDPGSTALGERLRAILLEPSQFPIGRRSEMLIYMAARAQLVEEVIRPALDDGAVVIADRFLLANVVYQGHAGGLDAAALWQVGEIAVAGMFPDMTFLLDLGVATATRRRDREPDRMEAQGTAFMQRVRDGFLLEASRHSESICVLDANRGVEEIQSDIRQIAAEMLASRNRH